MSDLPNTLFLRLEGPLQAWGDTSKFVIRRTMEAPTKSGVIGLICCAMRLSRQAARQHLRELNQLAMGVRIDRPGTRWWDYHTVGAKIGILKAEGGIKRTASTKEIETLVSRREYLCDASFLVALQGDPEVIQRVKDALRNPKWPPFLGRKSCPPTSPILAGETKCDDLVTALSHQRWRPRCESDTPRDEQGARLKQIQLDSLIQWQASLADDEAPLDAEVWYDAPVSFDPPVHEARLVERKCLTVEVGDPTQHHTPVPARLRTDYGKSTWGPLRDKRLEEDNHLCVFCKAPLTKFNATVQHVNYRHATKEDNRAALDDPVLQHKRLRDLRSLCRLCHDAVTMIEYGLGMGLDRINPCDPDFRDRIIKRRNEIIAFRSLETRKRRLSPEEVE